MTDSDTPTLTDTKTPDAATGWVDALPPSVRPYLRLMRADRAVGTWLLFWPCIVGALIGRSEELTGSRFWELVFLFLLGAFVMRSAGCIYNDLLDRDLDAQVARTANRPLASGAISARNAWILLIVLCVIGLLVLLQLGPVAIGTGLLSLGLVAAYPLMKRITWWPQVWLGMTFNWGILVGAAATGGTIPLTAILAYGAAILWTLGYDTIYAYQDIEDDALVGVKSSARRVGTDRRRAQLFILLCYANTIVVMAIAMGLGGGGSWLILLAPLAAHLGWQAWSLSPEEPSRCLAVFKSNIWAGALFVLPTLPL